MFLLVIAPYNRVIKPTKESEDFTYEKITLLCFLFVILLLGSKRNSPLFLFHDNNEHFCSIL